MKMEIKFINTKLNANVCRIIVHQIFSGLILVLALFIIASCTKFDQNKELLKAYTGKWYPSFPRFPYRPSPGGVVPFPGSLSNCSIDSLYVIEISSSGNVKTTNTINGQVIFEGKIRLKKDKNDIIYCSLKENKLINPRHSQFILTHISKIELSGCVKIKNGPTYSFNTRPINYDHYQREPLEVFFFETSKPIYPFYAFYRINQ